MLPVSHVIVTTNETHTGLWYLRHVECMDKNWKQRFYYRKTWENVADVEIMQVVDVCYQLTGQLSNSGVGTICLFLSDHSVKESWCMTG